VIYGDGTQSRDFTFVRNVVAGNLAAAQAAGAAGKVFNVASGRSYSLLNLVEALNQILGLQVKPQLEPARVGDVKDSLADISLATSELGYVPRVDFLEGLKRTVDSYRTSH
jgi:UDP-glucose 4-epimerase